MLRGYPYAVWATYRQWAELGAQVRKGEKASSVIFYKEYAVDADPNDTDDHGMRRVARASSVFNVAQVDGFAPAELPELPAITRIANAETLIVDSRAEIRHGGDMAYYRRPTSDGSGDFIQMPDERRFQASDDAQRSEDYYSVLLHELTHWTSPSDRCDRQLGKRFGDAAYAMEELVAELGAAFLCAELGITSTPRADHAGYIAHWLDVMKSDKRAIFTAAARASEAVAYLKRRAAS
jgi:antirestriction protein ArdC